jgi:glutamate decarboxylase
MALTRQSTRRTRHDSADDTEDLLDTAAELPTHRIPHDGMGREAAYELVLSALLLDGDARLNLATFVTTWMPPLAGRLMAETANKNMIDKDEYPQTAEIEARCVRMLAELWNSPQKDDATGCSTTGSSEAAMLCGLALKWRWRDRMKAAGKPSDKPNLVMGANVQVCWEKFCRYWDVEPRIVPMEGKRFHLGPAEAIAQCDENTIGVMAIVGSTFDGSYEPVRDIAEALDHLERDRGIHVPIHVDAASGGFVAPFIQPELVWDFRLERVVSIQSSGHKFGLVYPGVGWVLWRSAEYLPDDLVFHVNYLGGDMPTFALNFSRPGAQVVLQYYQFLRLGREGFRLVQQTCQDVAVHVSGRLAGMREFDVIADGTDLPVVTVSLHPEVTKYDVFDLSRKLRERGWLVPAYTMPPKREDLAVLRIVVRNGFSHDMAELFLRDLRAAVDWLDDLQSPMPHEEQPSTFHH